MSHVSKRNPLRRLFRGAAVIREDVDQEIRFHLEMRIAELERRGLSLEAARKEALRLFGDLDGTRVFCIETEVRSERRMKRRAYFQEVRQNIVHGFRHLRHRPLFAAATILTLALGIGAATAIFSAADHVLLRPLSYDDPAHAVTLWETDRSRNELKLEVSPGIFLDWKERSTSFAALGLAEPFGYDLTGETPPEAIPAWNVTEGFFEALGVRPLLGRSFTAEDYLPNSGPVVLISHGLWQRRYGTEPSIIGRVIQIDGAPATIVGVLPSWLEYPEPRDLWGPKRFRQSEPQDRSSRYMNVVARLRPGVSLPQAQAEMDAVTSKLIADHSGMNRNSGVRIVPLEEQILGEIRPALLVLLGSVAFVLVIACANVAGLLLSRGAERERELGIRAALGAGRARLARQLLTESLLLAALGGAGGIALARLGVDLLAALAPPGLPRATNIAVDGRVLVFAVAISMATAILFGLGPAIRFSRPDILATLRGTSRASSGGRERTHLRQFIVVTEIALSLVLLIGAGLLARSFVHLLENDPGFIAEKRLALQVFLWDRNPTVEARKQRVAEIIEKFQSTPGVEKVAVVSALPFHPHQIAARGVIRIDGQPAPRPGEESSVFTTIASPEYFEVAGIPLRRGRHFNGQDHANAPLVALINEALAQRLFPGEDPIGRRVTVGVMGRPMMRQIVGIVGSVRPTALDSDPRPELFIPFDQSGSGSVTFLVRVKSSPAELLPVLRAQLWQIDRDQAIYHAATVEDLVSNTLVPRRFHLVLVGLFSLAALLLATIGIYGLISFSTSQRVHEIGVRVAIGARPGDVVRMIVVEGIRLGIAGAILGIAGALALTRFLKGMLYGVTPTDPLIFAELTVLLLAVTALAAYVPARRAAFADPSSALRSE